MKDDDDIQRQVKSLYCATNKLRGTFDQCSTAVKNTLFCAYCSPMYACQLWSKYTQTSMKRLRAAYNNVYRIMHYIPRNVSVRPQQVSHCVRTFDALLRNNLYRFFIRCTSSSNFFIRSLQTTTTRTLFFFLPQRKYDCQYRQSKAGRRRKDTSVIQSATTQIHVVKNPKRTRSPALRQSAEAKANSRTLF